jgi:type VI secretion system secreted protein VgrG
MRDRNLRDVEAKYSEECDQDNGDEAGGSCNECTAGAVAATMFGGYVAYRCLRMLPSLLPPLWPTIPANLTLP